MKMWAHYERGSDGQPYMLEVSSDHLGLIERMDQPGDWIEEQQWIRFDQEKP